MNTEMNNNMSMNMARFPMIEEELNRLSSERKGHTTHERMHRKAIRRLAISLLLMTTWAISAPRFTHLYLSITLGIVLFINLAMALFQLISAIGSKPTRPMQRVMRSVSRYQRIESIGKEVRPVSLVLLLFFLPPMAVALLFGSDFFSMMELPTGKWFALSVLTVAAAYFLLQTGDNIRKVYWLRIATGAASLFLCVMLVAANFSISGVAPAMDASGIVDNGNLEYASIQCNSGSLCDVDAAVRLLVATIK